MSRSKPATVSAMPAAGIAETVAGLLKEIHTALYERALAFQKANTYHPENYADFKQALEKGWAIAWWCGDPACEAAIKEDTKATTRCIPLEQPGGEGACIRDGRPAKEVAVFARAY